jgi:hypothetical protein
MIALPIRRYSDGSIELAIGTTKAKRLSEFAIMEFVSDGEDDLGAWRTVWVRRADWPALRAAIDEMIEAKPSQDAALHRALRKT